MKSLIKHKRTTDNPRAARIFAGWISATHYTHISTTVRRVHPILLCMIFQLLLSKLCKYLHKNIELFIDTNFNWMYKNLVAPNSPHRMQIWSKRKSARGKWELNKDKSKKEEDVEKMFLKAFSARPMFWPRRLIVWEFYWHWVTRSTIHLTIIVPPGWAP